MGRGNGYMVYHAGSARCAPMPQATRRFYAVPEWRNGRRGGLKNLFLRECGFDSHLGHHRGSAGETPNSKRHSKNRLVPSLRSYR